MAPSVLAVISHAVTGVTENTQTDVELYEPSNAIPLSLCPLGFPSNHLPGRAFHYFIHRSSVDLTGPLHSQVWRELVLNVSTKSPAVQHAIVALSGFHERYTNAESTAVEEQCWRQYYLAVKGINGLLVRREYDGDCSRTVKEEVLVACAVFISIEILLGNTEGAIKHLEGGLALIQQFVTKGRTPLPSLRIESPGSSNTGDLEEAITRTYPSLDDKTIDLLGWYARLDLQVLSFLPTRHYSVSKPSTPPTYAIVQLSQPLPNMPSAWLYRLIKHSLYWIRHVANTFKYSPSVPPQVRDSRDHLLSALREWYTFFLSTNDPLNETRCMGAEIAHLLVAYHLIFLKLTTSLSPLEIAYDNPECQDSFRGILKYCILILLQRNPCGAPLTLPDNEEQKQFYFSLETSIIEPLYYVAIKCRERPWRRSAVLLLVCAGREGVWDGPVMSEVAEHVISLEHGERLPNCSTGERDMWLKQVSVKEAYRALGELWDTYPGENNGPVPEEKRVNTVAANVNLQEHNVEVTCGWFLENKRTWRHHSKVLRWENCTHRAIWV